jgi:quercetin dioxygenase-like cupin family protein
MSNQVTIRRRGDVSPLHVMGAEVSFLCPADRTGNAWSVMECTAPLHMGPPPHHHEWDEAYYIIEGSVKFSLDGKDIVLGAGEFVLIPGGTVHGFTGASERTARMLILDTPAHAEGFFVDAAREVKAIPQDLPKVPGIGERHGIHFLPPR